MISASKDFRLGEIEIISLAKELNGVAIIDDPVTGGIAESHGVKKEATI